jgi:pimeloyl-ACP methyl ester carboxylesterase
MTSALLTHRIDGTGDPVILLNGGMMTIGSWSEAATQLSAQWRVIRCDLRGQFLSPGPPLHTSLAEHVGDVVALLDALGIDRVHVIGTSFGAEVGLLFAATHPDRVRSLIAATATDWSPPELEAGALALRDACEEALRGGNRRALYDVLVPVTYSPAYLDANAAMLTARSAQVATLPDSWFAGTASIVTALLGLDLRPRLRDIRCPTLVIIAEHDAIMPLERSRALVQGIPDAEEAFVPGSGHALVVERLDVFLELCEAFLRRQ